MYADDNINWYLMGNPERSWKEIDIVGLADSDKLLLHKVSAYFILVLQVAKGNYVLLSLI